MPRRPSLWLSFVVIVTALVCTMVATGASIEPKSRLARRLLHKSSVAPPQYPIQSYGFPLSYYSIRGQLSTTLTLNNKGMTVLNPRVTLYARDGRRKTFTHIVISPRSFVEVNLREFAEQAGEGFEDGSLNVSYVGRIMEMGGLLRMTDSGSGIEYDEQLMYPASTKSNTLVGVGWLPSGNAEARVVVTNTTGADVQATLRFDGRAPETLTLGPWQLQVVDIRPSMFEPTRQLRPGAKIGSISVEHTSAPGAIVARGFVAEGAYSAVIPFIDRASFKSSRLVSNGVRLTGPDGQPTRPWIVAKNTSDAAIRLTGRIWVTSGQGEPQPVALPDTELASGELVFLDADAAWSVAAPLAALPTVSIEFEHSGPSGLVVVSAAAVSNDLRHVFRVPFYDPPAQPSAAGDYFWQVKDTRNTVIFISNTTGQKQGYRYLVRHEQGTWAPKAMTLEPHQTIAIDMALLRASGAQDSKGRVIPSDAASGQVHWSQLGGPRRALLGRVEQVDFSNDVSSTYACPPPAEDVYQDAWITPWIDETEPGQWVGYQVIERDRNGISDFEEEYDITDTLSWYSSVNSIAYPTSYAGWFVGADDGTTQVNAYGESRGFLSWNGEGQEPEGHESLSLWADIQVQCSSAVPTNMNQSDWGTSPTDYRLNVSYTWGSTVGVPNQRLTSCELQEYVTYPGSGSTYSFPAPFPAITVYNPTDAQSGNPVGELNVVPATSAFLLDRHRTPGTFRTYSEESIVANQQYQYRCNCPTTGKWVPLKTGLNITRQVFFDSVWKFKITKTGSGNPTNTVVLPPQ